MGNAEMIPVDIEGVYIRCLERGAGEIHHCICGDMERLLPREEGTMYEIGT